MEEKTSVKPPRPLLIVSDAPSAQTGLGRIAADLATGIHQHLSDVFRVATFGYGGSGSRRFSFPQYAVEGMQDWVLPSLPQIWNDFAGNEKGVILTIWDASRLTWFSRPAHSELLAANPDLRDWLVQPRFERWGYFPIDAEGPNGKLSFPLQQTLLGFDRVLAYTEWAQDVISRSFEGQRLPFDLDHLPHGIDTQAFFETHRPLCRQLFFRLTGAQTLTAAPIALANDELLIGIVATNQARKDWALGIETAALLAKNHKVRLWIHTDIMERAWSIPALLIDHGLLGNAAISLGYLPDDQMAEAYSACDVTLGIGLGEGWGFPLAESLACGTPVIHGNYGGGAEFVPASMKVEPVSYRSEGLYSCVRPVFRAQDWAERVLQIAGQRTSLDPQYAWSNLWPRWEAWFRKGLKL